LDTVNIKEEVVKEKYDEVAQRVNTGGSACLGATAAGGSSHDPITSNLYVNAAARAQVEYRFTEIQFRKSVLLWIGCIAAALEEGEYRAKLSNVGFEQVDIEPTRVYRVEDAREFLSGQGLDIDALAPQVDGKFLSAFIRGTKPIDSKDKTCCGPTCCN